MPLSQHQHVVIQSCTNLIEEAIGRQLKPGLRKGQPLRQATASARCKVKLHSRFQQANAHTLAFLVGCYADVVSAHLRIDIAFDFLDPTHPGCNQHLLQWSVPAWHNARVPLVEAHPSIRAVYQIAL